MNDRVRSSILKFAGCAAFTLLAVWLYMTVRDAHWGTIVDNVRILCDSFTLSGTILLGVGLLVALTNAGSLTGLSYVLRSMVATLIPGAALKNQTYADYLEERKNKKARGYGFLVAYGGAEIALSFLLLAVYYRFR